jgi:hypothetical protein
MKTFKEYLEEQIKGWKHAHSDLMKHRKDITKLNDTVYLHKLKADGSESNMHDAKKTFKDLKSAVEHHENIKRLNPGKKIKYNLYIDNKLHSVLQ